MLDIKKIRENPEYYIAETEKKYTTVSLKDVLAIDEERRPLLTEVERLKSERNAQSKLIGELKKKEPDMGKAISGPSHRRKTNSHPPTNTENQDRAGFGCFSPRSTP